MDESRLQRNHERFPFQRFHEQSGRPKQGLLESFQVRTRRSNEENREVRIHGLHGLDGVGQWVGQGVGVDDHEIVGPGAKDVETLIQLQRLRQLPAFPHQVGSKTSVDQVLSYDENIFVCHDHLASSIAAGSKVGDRAVRCGRMSRIRRKIGKTCPWVRDP